MEARILCSMVMIAFSSKHHCQDEINQLSNLEACVQDIKTWMTRNFPMLNTDKTEVIVLGPEHLRNKLSSDVATLNGITLASSSLVKNLGVVFEDMSFNKHPGVLMMQMIAGIRLGSGFQGKRFRYRYGFWLRFRLSVRVQVQVQIQVQMAEKQGVVQH